LRYTKSIFSGAGARGPAAPLRSAGGPSGRAWNAAPASTDPASSSASHGPGRPRPPGEPRRAAPRGRRGSRRSLVPSRSSVCTGACKPLARPGAAHLSGMSARSGARDRPPARRRRTPGPTGGQCVPPAAGGRRRARTDRWRPEVARRGFRPGELLTPGIPSPGRGREDTSAVGPSSLRLRRPAPEYHKGKGKDDVLKGWTAS